MGIPVENVGLIAQVLGVLLLAFLFAPEYASVKSSDWLRLQRSDGSNPFRTVINPTLRLVYIAFILLVIGFDGGLIITDTAAIDLLASFFVYLNAGALTAATFFLFLSALEYQRNGKRNNHPADGTPNSDY